MEKNAPRYGSAPVLHIWFEDEKGVRCTLVYVLKVNFYCINSLIKR